MVSFKSDYEPKLDQKNELILEILNPSKDSKILVIGTGVYPKNEFFFYKYAGCKEITGSDIDKINLVSARKALPDLNFIYLDAQKIFPLNDNEFDYVILTEVLEHLKDEHIALYEIRRVLKPKGVLLLTVPKRRWYSIFNPITFAQHYREYSESSIQKVLERHKFIVEVLLVGGSFYDLLNLWIHLIFKYLFRSLRPDPFFGRKVEKFWQKAKLNRGMLFGFDILVKARAIK